MEYTEKLGSSKLLNLRNVPARQTRKEVEKYLRSHPRLIWPDEMAEELGIDYQIVLTMVRELLKKGKVEEAKAETVQI